MGFTDKSMDDERRKLKFNIAKSMHQFLPPHLAGVLTVEETAKVSIILALNSLAGFNPETGQKSYVRLYLNGSLVNHSCDPNTKCGSLGSSIHYITIRPVRKGEEITFDYNQWPKRPNFRARRKIILERFSFICACSLCRQESKK